MGWVLTPKTSKGLPPQGGRGSSHRMLNPNVVVKAERPHSEIIVVIVVVIVVIVVIVVVVVIVDCYCFLLNIIVEPPASRPSHLA